jgi:V8-like Glu-specific endopeptidase
MTARPLALFLALATAACVPDDETEGLSSPLIGGDIHTGDEAAVAITTPGGDPFCTGTLVSPSVVATAAHCIDMAAGDPEITIFFGDDTESDGRKVGVKLSAAHPDWTGSLADEHDIGVMVLNFPQDPFLPIPLNTSPMTDHVGDTIRRIGFGIYDRDTGDIDGKKREGSTTVTQVSTTGDWFLAGDDNLSTCNGDSGGPALLTIEETEYLAGVHSFGFDNGDTRCVPPNNGDTRVDLYADSFLRPYIDDNDPTCGADGLCAPIGCTDDPDCEPCGADGTCTDDCPLPDPDCPSSELGELCQAHTQCTTGLCVFWFGDPNTRFCSRECSGDGDCPAGMSCQEIATFGDICYYDDAPAGVLGDDCDTHTDCGSYICELGRCVIPCDLTKGMGCATGFECSSLDDGVNYYCHSLDSGEGGGCCSATDRDPTIPGLLALLLVAAVARRRRATC